MTTAESEAHEDELETTDHDGEAVEVAAGESDGDRSADPQVAEVQTDEVTSEA